MTTHFFSDTATLTGRSLRHILRSPDTIIITIDRREVLRDLHGRVIEMQRADAPVARHLSAVPA